MPGQQQDQGRAPGTAGGGEGTFPPGQHPEPVGHPCPPVQRYEYSKGPWGKCAGLQEGVLSCRYGVTQDLGASEG